MSHYNTVRLHRAFGYVTPQGKLQRREEEIFRSRDRKLEDARALRRDRRAAQRNAEGTEANAVAAQAGAVPAAGSAQPPVDPAPRPARTSESRGPAVSTVPERPVAQARIDDVTLQALRNDVPLLDAVTELQVPTTTRGSRVCFRCPDCASNHTSVNRRSNLGRCFRCERNFNPIELVMAERGCDFLEAVSFLERVRDA